MSPSQLALIQAVRDGAIALVLAIDEFTAGIDEEKKTIEPDPNASCQHPEDRRKPMPVMGAAERFFCLACQTIVN